MAGFDLFSPLGTNTTAVSASGTTANGALNVPSVTTDLSGSGFTRSGNVGSLSCRVYNACSVTAFINFGVGSGTAATTSQMPIPAGGVECFEISPQTTYAAAILGSSTGTVYFTPGRGG